MRLFSFCDRLTISPILFSLVLWSSSERELLAFPTDSIPQTGTLKRWLCFSAASTNNLSSVIPPSAWRTQKGV